MLNFFFSFPRVHFALFTLPFPLLYHQLKIHEKKKQKSVLTDPVRCLWDFKVYILKAQFDILFIILHLFGHNYRDGPWLFALKSKLTFLTYIYIKKNLTAPNLLKAPGGRGLHVVTVAIMTESTLQGTVASWRDKTTRPGSEICRTGGSVFLSLKNTAFFFHSLDSEGKKKIFDSKFCLKLSAENLPP